MHAGSIAGLQPPSINQTKFLDSKRQMPWQQHHKKDLIPQIAAVFVVAGNDAGLVHIWAGTGSGQHTWQPVAVKHQVCASSIFQYHDQLPLQHLVMHVAATNPASLGLAAASTCTAGCTQSKCCNATCCLKAHAVLRCTLFTRCGIWCNGLQSAGQLCSNLHLCAAETS